MRRRSRFILATLAAVLLAASCSRKPEPAAEHATAEPEPPPPRKASSEEEVVLPHGGEATLLEPGAEPRRELRFALVEGARSRYQLDHSTRVTKHGPAGDQQHPAPTLRTYFEATVGPPVGEDFGIEWFVTGADLADPDTLPPASHESVRSSLASMAGVRGSWQLTARGEVRDSNHATPNGLAAHVRGGALRLAALLEEQVPILPVEAVGQGARWKVRRTVLEQEYRVLHETTFTLDTLAEGKALLLFTTERSADRQVATRPGSTTSAELIRLEGSAQGHVEIELARPLPIQRASDATGEQDISLVVSGNAQLNSISTAIATRLSLIP